MISRAVNLHQTVGEPGALETLRSLALSSVSSLPENGLLALMRECGVEEPKATIAEFTSQNLLTRIGDGYGLSDKGVRTHLLLEAVNGGDLRELYRRLAALDTTLRMYELVREGMAQMFLQSLVDRPGFGRVYLCSPWISLDKRQEERLEHALSQAEEKRGIRPEVLVIVRPEQGQPGNVPSSVARLQTLGAKVFLNGRLHTKLYIREPDRNGGYAMAIVGSQNLTRSTYLELGIRINSESEIIGELIRYFWDLTNYSQEC